MISVRGRHRHPVLCPRCFMLDSLGACGTRNEANNLVRFTAIYTHLDLPL